MDQFKIKEGIGVVENRRWISHISCHFVVGDRSLEGDSIGELIEHREEDTYGCHCQKAQSTKLSLVAFLALIVKLHGRAEKVHLGDPFILSNFADKFSEPIERAGLGVSLDDGKVLRDDGLIGAGKHLLTGRVF